MMSSPEQASIDSLHPSAVSPSRVCKLRWTLVAVRSNLCINIELYILRRRFYLISESSAKDFDAAFVINGF